MNIFKFEFKRGIKSTLIWSLICSLILIFFISIFPSMKSMGMEDLIGSKLDSMSKNILKAFNIENSMDFSNLLDYLSYAFQYIVMASGIYGLILGSSLLVKEESEGTIEFLYSKPTTRINIVTNKICSIVLLYILYIFIIGITTMIVSLFVKPTEMDTMDLLLNIKIILLGTMFLGFIFMSLGILISTLLKSIKKAIPISMGIFFISYFMGIIGKLQKNLESFKYLSPFDYVVPINLIRDGIKSSNLYLGFIIILISLILSYIIYMKKDLKV